MWNENSQVVIKACMHSLFHPTHLILHGSLSFYPLRCSPWKFVYVNLRCWLWNGIIPREKRDASDNLGLLITFLFQVCCATKDINTVRQEEELLYCSTGISTVWYPVYQPVISLEFWAGAVYVYFSHCYRFHRKKTRSEGVGRAQVAHALPLPWRQGLLFLAYPGRCLTCS